MDDWAVCIPFLLYLGRAIIPLGLAGVPRNHPHREVLLVLLLQIGVAGDLVDGAIARALGITGWAIVYWGDHLADLVFFLGSMIVIGGRLSWARDLPPRQAHRRSSVERRGERARLAAWIVLAVLLAGVIYVLIFQRMVRVR